MTSPIEPRTASLYHAPRSPAVEPATAIAAVGAALASYLIAVSLVPASARFAAAQLTLAAVAAGAVAIAQRARPFAALGLRGARPRFFIAAIAVGATAWYVNNWIDLLISHLAPSQAQIRRLEALIEHPPLWQALAAYAVLPALCEELVFRGALARSLGRRSSLIAAALASAVVFSAYHLSLVQALPTLTLGLALGVIAIRADSVVPAMLAHAINNALVIAVSRGALPSLAGWLERHPALALAGCTAATLGGVALAAWPDGGAASPVDRPSGAAKHGDGTSGA